jgi:hypothetical protein
MLMWSWSIRTGPACNLKAGDHTQLGRTQRPPRGVGPPRPVSAADAILSVVESRDRQRSSSGLNLD